MYDKQLKTLIKVADCDSFSKAGESLYLSATSVMKQINNLEEDFNLKLFDRDNRGVSLTDAGKVIYDRAKEIIEFSEKSLEEARRASLREQKVFRVGSSILNPCKPFMDIWDRVSERFPNYSLQIIPYDDDHQDILSEVSSLGEKFDFMVGGTDSQLWMDRANFLQLGYYEQVIAVSKSHPLAKKDFLKIEDLFGETVMLVKEGDSETVDRIREELSSYPQIKLEDTPRFYDMGVFNKAVKERKLLVSLNCWDRVHPSLKNIPIAWDHHLPYGILYEENPNDDIKKFLKLAKEVIGE